MLIYLAYTCILLTNCHEKKATDNQLSRQEKKQGWILLFDGKTTDGWRGYNLDTITPNWQAVDGCLTADGSKGDIITNRQFRNFEFKADWKISEGGNSGIFFHVREGDYDMVWRTGVEMQVLDNQNNPNGEIPNRSAGSVYDLYAPTGDFTEPAGEFNHARIMVQDGHVQYFLNGSKILEYTLWSDEWYNDIEKTIHNTRRKPDWGRAGEGHIALQDEGYRVWFKNIKVREL